LFKVSVLIEMVTPRDDEGSVQSAGRCWYKYKRVAGARSGESKCAVKSLFPASTFYRHVPWILAKSTDRFRKKEQTLGTLAQSLGGKSLISSKIKYSSLSVTKSCQEQTTFIILDETIQLRS
jgi:hypothetical protein